MFACLFFGDSLSLGTAAAVNARLTRPCEVRAVSGAASNAMLRWTLDARSYDTAILSIGSNDDIGVLASIRGKPQASTAAGRKRSRFYARIGILRQNLPSRRVIWILPYNRARAAIVSSIAMRFGDEVLDIAQFPTRDGLHPATYSSVARRLLK